ncbi:DNA-binding transcription factor [Aureococcus anophagefferens]|uniref:DNA-binding transcription factor n=1 Tax=Aureococcus anophagefferens TaxID=44056 RepID=A0ABR1G487_AURAN
MMNALLPGDEDELMHDVSLFGEIPAGHRHVLKRSDAGSPGAGLRATPPEFKRPNLQTSPGSRGAGAMARQPKAANLSTKRRWSKQEDEKLCAAVKAVGLSDWKTIADVYMQGHDLSDAQCMHRWQKVLRPGLVKGAFCEKEDKVIVDCLREGGLKRRWTKQEDEKLCLAVKAVGPHDWKAIAEVHLAGHGRSDVQCLHRWQKVLRAGLVKGAFTEEEDKIIIECMREGGLTWMQIAERIPGRIGKQCRERWTNHLDPNLKKGGWTHEEDTILAEAQQRWGNAWTKIAKLLPGRAENAVKNRWNSAFRRKKSAMFGKAPAEEDTAAIARARMAMEIIDRDEREPGGDAAKGRGPKRVAAGAAAGRRRPAPRAAGRRRQRAPGPAAAAAPPPAAARSGSDSGADAAAALDAAGGAGDLRRPGSPSEVLDLFGGRKGGDGDFPEDHLLGLDDMPGGADDDLDVSFDALDMAGVEPVDLTGTGHTPLSEPGGEVLKMDGFSPAKGDHGDLFYQGRTGLTPSGPLAKTPAGMMQGLSPLHAHYQRLHALHGDARAAPRADERRRPLHRPAGRGRGEPAERAAAPRVRRPAARAAAPPVSSAP